MIGRGAGFAPDNNFSGADCSCNLYSTRWSAAARCVWLGCRETPGGRAIAESSPPTGALVMSMVCPKCNGSFEQRLQCPACNVRLLYQAPSRRRGESAEG